MSFTLAPLPYAYEALEPHIDVQTMQIHHGKHHQAYVDNLNKAIAGTEHESKTIEEIVAPKYWASHNFSDGFWASGDILTQGWTWLDRYNNFTTSEECRLEIENRV
jgi:hypothetical protein